MSGPVPVPDLPDLPWTAPDADGWRRLDPRMTLLAGVRNIAAAAIPALPALFGLLGSIGRWAFAVVALAALLLIALGVAEWLTTGYRDSPRGLELRRGLLGRSVQTAPRDRIRSIDLTAPFLHRLLGVTKISVGTGVDEKRLELGAVTHREAARLRAVLFEGGHTATAAAPEPVGGEVPRAYPLPAPPPADVELAQLDWAWVRYAPLNLGRLAVALGAILAASQFLPNLGVDESGLARDTWDFLSRQALAILAAVGVVVALVAWLVGSTLAFALQWGGYRLSRRTSDAVPALHLTAGLLSTRSVTVEERRIRGVVLTEPLLLRWAGGAELATLATGVESGVTAVVPPAPRSVARSVGVRVLDDAGAPGADAALGVPLVGHGPRARRRSHVRHQRSTLLLLLGALISLGLGEIPDAPGELRDVVPLALLALAAVVATLGVWVAEMAWRHLGHAVARDEHGAARFLVAGSGESTRRRTVLEVDGIIGWVQRATWFQRRVGLVTLLATTAAGSERVTLLDVPLPLARDLLDACTPQLLEPFAVGSAPGPTLPSDAAR